MSWIEKVKLRLPNLQAAQFFFTHGNIIINDVFSRSAVELFSDAGFNIPITVIDAYELTQRLTSLVDFSVFDSVILPGNGSRIVANHLTTPFHALHVAARRVGYKNPKPEVTHFSVPKGSVAVLDDVVSSGDTAYEVFVKGIWRPALLATWIIQYPRDSRLTCYESIYASLCVGGEKGKVPVNSLSTLLSQSAIAESYAKRFCERPSDFFTALELLKEEQKA